MGQPAIVTTSPNGQCPVAAANPLYDFSFLCQPPGVATNCYVTDTAPGRVETESEDIDMVDATVDVVMPTIADKTAMPIPVRRLCLPDYLQHSFGLHWAHLTVDYHPCR
jgi:hypothetical protein